MFVTPNTHWGYPAALKNAINHLYGEGGGSLLRSSATARRRRKSAAQLRQVTEGLKMRPVATMPGITQMIKGSPVARQVRHVLAKLALGLELTAELPPPIPTEN